MTIEYVPVSGEGRLWAERSGDGAPVVLLHGSVHDSRLWDSVFTELAAHHTAIRYDARGLGRSTPPTAPFRYEDDLLAVLDHFGIERAALVGLSMGGEVALDFTLEHPERVRSLTLVAASASGHDWPQSPELDAYTAANLGSDPDSLAEMELAVWASLGDQAPGYPAIATMVTENAKVRAAVEKGHVLFPEEDAVDHLERVEAQTTVVVGDHDHPEIGVIARRLAEGIPAHVWRSWPGLITIFRCVRRNGSQKFLLRFSDFVGSKGWRVAEYWFRVALVGLSCGAAETEPSRFWLAYFPGGAVFDAVVASAECAEVSW